MDSSSIAITQRIRKTIGPVKYKESTRRINYVTPLIPVTSAAATTTTTTTTLQPPPLVNPLRCPELIQQVSGTGTGISHSYHTCISSSSHPLWEYLHHLDIPTKELITSYCRSTCFICNLRQPLIIHIPPPLPPLRHHRYPSMHPLPIQTIPPTSLLSKRPLIKIECFPT